MGERNIDIQDLHDDLIEIRDALRASNEIARVRARAEIMRGKIEHANAPCDAPGVSFSDFDALLDKVK